MNWLAIQTVAVVLTGAVVFWYTVETYKLRKNSDRQQELAQRQADISRQQAVISDRQALISERQMESAIRPFVVLHAMGDSHVVKNMGIGSALDVSVDDVLIDADLELSLTFRESISLLPPGESASMRAEATVCGEPTDMPFVKIALHERYIEARTEVVLRYRNIEGKEYVSRQLYMNGRLSLSGVQAATGDAVESEGSDGTPDA